MTIPEQAVEAALRAFYKHTAVQNFPRASQDQMERALEAALPLLACSQPASEEDWNATQRPDGTWAADDPPTTTVAEQIETIAHRLMNEFDMRAGSGASKCRNVAREIVESFPALMGVERHEPLAVAARGLANAADGLSFAEAAVREAIGNTNWSVLRHWIDEVRAALPPLVAEERPEGK